ncbi:MAG: hypothetical protein HY820_24230 [Acidobacteria bacterium]|nr:hypothetical protein [Acidobacteriota bacterium]
MRWTLALFLLPALFASNPELKSVKSVYLLPMSNGFDQYLANHILGSSVYVVVADPQSADAILTDNIGPAFEQKLTELYSVKKEEDEEEAEGIKGNDQVPRAHFRGGKGMVFLVERKTKQVVWSTYERPKDTRPSSLNQAAKRVAGKLKKELTGQVPSK